MTPLGTSGQPPQSTEPERSSRPLPTFTRSRRSGLTGRWMRLGRSIQLSTLAMESRAWFDARSRSFFVDVIQISARGPTDAVRPKKHDE
jgi:hypothetical protein